MAWISSVVLYWYSKRAVDKSVIVKWKMSYRWACVTPSLSRERRKGPEKQFAFGGMNDEHSDHTCEDIDSCGSPGEVIVPSCVFLCDKKKASLPM